MSYRLRNGSSSLPLRLPSRTGRHYAVSVGGADDTTRWLDTDVTAGLVFNLEEMHMGGARRGSSSGSGSDTANDTATVTDTGSSRASIKTAPTEACASGNRAGCVLACH